MFIRNIKYRKVIFLLSVFFFLQTFFVLAETKNSYSTQIYFEEIKNNTISMFRAIFLNYNVILNKNEALFIVKNNDEDSKNNANGIYHPIRLKFLNTSDNLKIIGKDRVAENLGNSYNGKNIKLFEQILYFEMYPGIDIIYYGNKDDLVFDFVLKEGSDINNVVFEFDGVENLNLDEKNNLVIQFSNNIVKQASPKIYKVVNGEKIEIKGNIIIKSKNQIGFVVK